MGSQTAKTTRKPRADSVRNREKLLVAAAEIFRNGGAGASLEGVARRAEVGVGTLYRHFPTREALFDAVYRREVEQLVDLAEALGDMQPPIEALRRWLHAAVGMVATKKGMLAALALSADSGSSYHAQSFERMTAAARPLLSRSVAAGDIRDDVSAEDVLWAMIGMCHMRSQPGWQESVLRLVDVFVDGLRRTAVPGRQPQP